MKEKGSQHSTWIWYPGDFEIWLGNRFNNRRTERGAMFPPFWKQDSHWPTVLFTKTIHLDEPETIAIATEGCFSLKIDGQLQFGMPSEYTVAAGDHLLELKVWNQASPPALYISGDTIHTDNTWLCTFEDKIWIDENGVAHGSGVYVPAGCWDFNTIGSKPSDFHLPCCRREPVASEKTDKGLLLDFGCETFGYVLLEGINGEGEISLYYGESREEALDPLHCETLDIMPPATYHGTNLRFDSKAFRYICLDIPPTLTVQHIGMDYEESDITNCDRGEFLCNDKLLNRIWEVCAYTLDLTTREFFMDGIKRDRWTWSGDAIQSYQMNYYHRFDLECVKRTIRQLRGKDPVTAHINTIMDYTFYWFKSVTDYYQYTGDAAFVREIYPRMLTLMDYCLGRTNAEGMAEGQPDDWIFVDWVDFPMHKRGILCFEQILFCKALESMACCARICDDIPTAERFEEKSKDLFEKTRRLFWDESRGAFLHSLEDGQLNEMVTKFPNMFAIIYGYANEHEKATIKQQVMLNDDVPPITTPYMRYYELEALCMMGMQQKVLQEIRDYWGGMLREGATSFWEKYNPQERGTEHLAMYGRPYGKSLCHAWGASPLYLLGKYFLGVRPVKPGYKEFEIRPVLGDLRWMVGSVPIPHGEIQISMNTSTIKVNASHGHGYLYFSSTSIPHASFGQLEPKGENKYRLWIEDKEEYVIKYTNL